MKMRIGFTRIFIALLSLEAGVAVSAPVAYVPSDTPSNVSVIDLATNSDVATVPIPGIAHSGVAVNTTGTRAYITNIASGGQPGSVSVFDTATNTSVAVVPVGLAPYGVAVNPSGSRAFVANHLSSSVSVIDTVTNAVIATIPITGQPWGVTVHPAGTFAYVANSLSFDISVIDTQTNSLVSSIPLATTTVDIVVNPSGTRAYATAFTTVKVIDTSSNTVVASVPCPTWCSGIAVNPSGTRLYVVDRDSNSTLVIDAASNAVVAAVPVGTTPRGVSVDPSGVRVYVTNSASNSVSIIDAATNTIVGSIPLTGSPGALGTFIGPSPITLMSSTNPSTVGLPVTFTATMAGLAPTGTVSFTDGSVAIGGCGAVALTGTGDARVASCMTTALTQGLHTINANYAGDPENPNATAGAIEIVLPRMPGAGAIAANPYGAMSVQGATLNGSAITNLQPGAIIQLGSTAGGAGSFAEIDFQSLSIGPGDTLTVRSGAAGQAFVLANIGDSRGVIAGTLLAEGGNGAAAPALFVQSPAGMTLHSGSNIAASGGLTLDTLGGTVTTGSSLVNGGVIDGGIGVRLLASTINGGGAFKGNAVTLSTFGNANNPVNGAHYLANSLQLFPSTGTDLALTIGEYGSAPQFMNMMVTGNASIWMPSSWPQGSTFTNNSAPLAAGAIRPAGVPEPSYGGGSIILQTTGNMTLFAGPTNDFVFPGGIALKAGGTLDINGVIVNQGWTTSGKAFQGIYFESPNIVSSLPVSILSNDLNWTNFSTVPNGHFHIFRLVQMPDGSAQYVPADGAAPHQNTYSTLIEAAANGQCWTCLVNYTPINVQ
jgi:YVTN family beta-propeller protein